MRPRETAFRIFAGLFNINPFKNCACSGLFGLFALHAEREQAQKRSELYNQIHQQLLHSEREYYLHFQ